jgi:hypothetical protein
MILIMRPLFHAQMVWDVISVDALMSIRLIGVGCKMLCAEKVRCVQTPSVVLDILLDGAGCKMLSAEMAIVAQIPSVVLGIHWVGTG